MKMYNISYIARYDEIDVENRNKHLELHSLQEIGTKIAKETCEKREEFMVNTWQNAIPPSFNSLSDAELFCDMNGYSRFCIVKCTTLTFNPEKVYLKLKEIYG